MQVQLRRGDVSEIARRASLPRQTVSDVVAGRTRNPGVHTVRAIEDAISQLEAERSDQAVQGLVNGCSTVGEAPGAGEADR